MTRRGRRRRVSVSYPPAVAATRRGRAGRRPRRGGPRGERGATPSQSRALEASPWTSRNGRPSPVNSRTASSARPCRSDRDRCCRGTAACRGGRRAGSRLGRRAIGARARRCGPRAASAPGETFGHPAGRSCRSEFNRASPLSFASRRQRSTVKSCHSRSGSAPRKSGFSRRSCRPKGARSKEQAVIKAIRDKGDLLTAADRRIRETPETADRAHLGRLTSHTRSAARGSATTSPAPGRRVYGAGRSAPPGPAVCNRPIMQSGCMIDADCMSRRGGAGPGGRAGARFRLGPGGPRRPPPSAASPAASARRPARRTGSRRPRSGRSAPPPRGRVPRRAGPTRTSSARPARPGHGRGAGAATVRVAGSAGEGPRERRAEGPVPAQGAGRAPGSRIRAA